MGGGCCYFMIDDIFDLEYLDIIGYCGDECDLLGVWMVKFVDYKVIYIGNEFVVMDFDSDVWVFGLFELLYMQYEFDCIDDVGNELLLVELMQVVIICLLCDEDGFVLMVEGGWIDYVYYGVNVVCVLVDMDVFDMVVVVVFEMISVEDMLIIVIVDYSYIMIMVGYLWCNNFIFGKVVYEIGVIVCGDDGMLYIIFGYVNGQFVCCKFDDGIFSCDWEDFSDIDIIVKNFQQ